MSCSPLRRPLLDVRGLSVEFVPAGGERVRAVDQASLEIPEGGTLGLFGESGCGKTTLALSIARLLPPSGRIVSGRILFAGEDLAATSDRRLREVRGQGIAYVFQDPSLALCPVMSVGDQVTDVLRVGTAAPRRLRREQAERLLGRVRLPEPGRIYSAYPHQLSGGQRQRVVIALAAACRPRLLVADEPTTALDGPLRGEIVTLLDELRQEVGMAMLWIAHDSSLLRCVTDRVAVMHAGRIVECGPTEEILERPRRADTVTPVQACVPLHASVSNVSGAGRLAEQAAASLPFVRARGVRKDFGRGRFASPSQVVHALDGVDLEIFRGETLGLVGPSGAGKSTLARCLMRLESPTDGEVWFDGFDLMALPRQALRRLRRRMQLIFQDPARAMNPRLTAVEIVSEPLRVQRLGSPPERRRRAISLLERVGLRGDWAGKRPLEFSGGQRQRLAIARALALEPDFLVLDEALSALDRWARDGLMDLLRALRKELGLTYLVIAHDLGLVAELADRVAVMRAGRIVEMSGAIGLSLERMPMAVAGDRLFE